MSYEQQEYKAALIMARDGLAEAVVWLDKALDSPIKGRARNRLLCLRGTLRKAKRENKRLLNSLIYGGPKFTQEAEWITLQLDPELKEEINGHTA